MISDLRKDGFHISLWQLPYFVPGNKYFGELVDKGLAVKNGKGTLPYEDAVLDFTNPATVEWYQDKLAGLLKMGVGAIKVDFGEAAPVEAVYNNGRTGWYEHNIYPVRYNKAVADITKKVNGENIIWARSAWSGASVIRFTGAVMPRLPIPACRARFAAVCRSDCRASASGAMT